MVAERMWSSMVDTNKSTSHHISYVRCSVGWFVVDLVDEQQSTDECPWRPGGLRGSVRRGSTFIATKFYQVSALPRLCRPRRRRRLPMHCWDTDQTYHVGSDPRSWWVDESNVWWRWWYVNLNKLITFRLSMSTLQFLCMRYIKNLSGTSGNLRQNSNAVCHCADKMDLVSDLYYVLLRVSQWVG